MKLDFESIKAWLRTPAGVKAIVLVVALALAVAGVAYLTSKADEWRSARKTADQKEAIKEKANELANITVQIENLQGQREAKKAEIEVAANSYLDAVNADTGAREETNRALGNLANTTAANSNRGNVSAADLERILNGL